MSSHSCLLMVKSWLLQHFSCLQMTSMCLELSHMCSLAWQPLFLHQAQIPKMLIIQFFTKSKVTVESFIFFFSIVEILKLQKCWMIFNAIQRPPFLYNIKINWYWYIGWKSDSCFTKSPGLISHLCLITDQS